MDNSTERGIDDMRKELQRILGQWKRNELSLLDAARALVAIGFAPNDAFDLLART